MKKKGFTLIELLAVIIILAVIALIATPVVLNLIEKMRIKAAESSAKGYTKAVEYGIMNDGYFNNISFDGEYDVENNELAISYQGDGPSKGVFTIEKNKVTYGEFCINGYPIKYENDYGKYTPNLLDCGGNKEPIEPDGPIATDLCEDAINYDDVTNINIEKAEDLACISYLSNIESKTFEGKTLSLIADIDFNDDNSYRDITNTQIYKDMNGNGIEEDIKTEVTTSKGFKPIGNSSVPFSGTFEGYGYEISNLYINRGNEDNIALFGFVTDGLIRGINFNNVSITGYNQVAGVVGYLYSGEVNEINIQGTIKSNFNHSGAVVGYNNSSENKITSVLVNANISGRDGIGGIYGFSNNKPPIISGVFETGSVGSSYNNGKVTGDTSINGTIYVSSKVTGTGFMNRVHGTSYNLSDNMLSGYDEVLDTWIGGDNDSSGYYFDYDDNNKIVVKSVKRNPITFTLKGNGTESSPYLISDYQDWKEATTKVKENIYFKLNNDIDFADKPFYMMGTGGNYFVGVLDGDYYKLSNISINGINNVGIIGYNNGGTIEGLNIDTLNVSSVNNNIGGIVGYNATGSVIGINTENIIINGYANVGGVVGYLDKGIINEINMKGNVTSSFNHSGGIAGYSNSSDNKITSVIVNGNISGRDFIGGIYGFSNNRPLTISGVFETGSVGSSYNNGKVTGDESMKGTAYVSNKVTGTGFLNRMHGTSYNLSNNMLSGYDEVLDTWIGGDNDSSGYYFDYNENNEIVVKSIKKNPITFNLKGNGTESSPYLINNYQDWKEATTKIKQDVYFKLNNDIDFADKPFYMMGTGGNYFVGVLDGNYHKLSNISINGINNVGIIGYNNGGTIKGLNIDTLNVSSINNNIGGIVGYNATGSVIGINAENIIINGYANVGGVVGYLNKGIINEMNMRGNVTSSFNHSGGIAGYSNSSDNKITSVIVHGNIYGRDFIGGIYGFSNNRPLTISGVFETGSVGSSYNNGKVTGDESMKGTAYVSNKITGTGFLNRMHGTSYNLSLPTTVIDSGNTEIDSLSFYDSKGVLDTVIGGDNDNSGYYLDYNNSGDKIIVVPVGGAGDSTNPDNPSNPTIEIDPNYTMTNIVDGIAPTCELYYVVPVSNGIRASFSCTDDEDIPEARSLFDSTTEKSAATFDTIGTLKSGSVSGTTKTVISTWNVNNPISQPTPGTCYYFRYGAKDSKGNFSTYVTNICYKGFSS